MKTIQTDKAPKVVGPYSQAIEANGFIFCSGQIGLDPKTNMVVEGIEKQINQIMNNLKAVLKSADSDFNNVVKTTIYLTDMDNYALVNKVYGEYFKENKPARATVQVNKLPLNVLVEIDCVAVKKDCCCEGGQECCKN
ncbi:MAG: RidA family protein [bacterium]|nr:RidA family protein [bacterium]